MAAPAAMGAQALARKASPIALRKLKCITVDVTGTLIAYKGLLGDYYCMAAKAAGVPCPDYDRMHAGFKVAYTDMATKYPCFGNAARMPNVDWWRECVRNSFLAVRSSISSESLLIEFDSESSFGQKIRSNFQRRIIEVKIYVCGQ